MKDILSRLKQEWLAWRDALQDITKQAKGLKISLDQLQASLFAIEKLQQDLNVDVEKMNFKNKPHLERIDEAQQRIEKALNKEK